MSNSLVKFKKCTLDSYNKLKKKDTNTLYFIEDKKAICKGENFFCEDVKFVDVLPEKGEPDVLYITSKGDICQSTQEDSLEQGKWKYLNAVETKLDDDRKIEVPVTGEAVKDYIKYKFLHAPIKIDCTNIRYDNSKLKKTEKTDLQEVLNDVITISDNIRKSFAHTIGIDDNQTFTKMSEEFISYKAKFAEILRSKGLVTVSDTQPLIQLINRVNDITNMNVINNTKLNVKPGTVKEIEFSKPINLDQLCLSLIKYIPGDEGEEHYSCHFDNSDSINFKNADSIKFNNGIMKQDVKSLQFKCKDITDQTKVSEGKVYEVEIDKSLFYKISNFEINESEEGELVLDILGTHKPTMVYSKDNIDLKNVYEITKINWRTNVGNDNKLLAIFSFDGGRTYKSLYNDQLVTVDPKDLNDVSKKGMNQSIINSLTNVQWEKLRQAGDKVMVAYYFEMNNAEEKCENDDIIMNVNMKGTNEIPKDGDYSYKLSEDGKKVIITFNKEGTYTILWADSNIEKKNE